MCICISFALCNSYCFINLCGIDSVSSLIYRIVPSDKRKLLESNCPFLVPRPVGTEVTTQPEGKEERGRGNRGFKQSFVLLVWSSEVFCEDLCGK